jgi:hypothetical protein
MAPAPFDETEQINISVAVAALVVSPNDHPSRVAHPELHGIAFGELAHIRQRSNFG